LCGGENHPDSYVAITSARRRRGNLLNVVADVSGIDASYSHESASNDIWSAILST